MSSKSELCPKCGKLRNLTESTEIYEQMDESGATKTFKVTSYYCEACTLFIKSEEEGVRE